MVVSGLKGSLYTDGVKDTWRGFYAGQKAVFEKGWPKELCPFGL